MKLFIAIASLLFVSLVAAEENVCFAKVENACQKNNGNLDIGGCNAKLTEVEFSKDLLSYPNDQLVASYDYLLLSTLFNSYQKDRPGFAKLFRSLSDQAFENSFNLIKQITRRGGEVDITKVGSTSQKLDLNELQSVAKALDVEKNLFKRSSHLHAHFTKHIVHRDNNQSTRSEPSKAYDPEMSQFLEEEFLTKQSATIRKLSGYTNDLWKIMKNGDEANTPLGVYLFDQYLAKQ